MYLYDRFTRRDYHTVAQTFFPTGGMAAPSPRLSATTRGTSVACGTGCLLITLKIVTLFETLQ